MSFCSRWFSSDQEVVRVLLGARHAVDVGLEARRQLALGHVRRQLSRELRRVLEREVLGRRLEEEIKRIEHRHLGNQIDFDAERGGLVREDQTRQVVGLWILLPVDEMGRGLDAHRIAEDAGARVRGGTQPDDLRTQIDGSVVPVMGHVVQRDVDGHSRLQGWHEQGMPKNSGNDTRARATDAGCVDFSGLGAVGLNEGRPAFRIRPAPGSRG